MRNTLITLLGVFLVAFIGCDQQPIVSPNPTMDSGQRTSEDPVLQKTITSRAFEAVLHNEEVVDPGITRHTGNVTHVRGLTVKGRVSGDYIGSFDANVYNSETIVREEQHIVQTLTSRGKFDISVSALFGAEVAGAWVGNVHVISHTYADGSRTYQAKFTARGTGDLNGMQMIGSAVPGDPGTFQMQGRILDTTGQLE